MKKWFMIMLLTSGLVVCVQGQHLLAEDDNGVTKIIDRTITTGAGSVEMKATVGSGGSVSGSNGVSIDRGTKSLTVTGIAGSVTGTLRLNWGGAGASRSRSPSSTRSPPGAPELPANFMFGGGFLVLGFGLLLTRRLW